MRSSLDTERLPVDARFLHWRQALSRGAIVFHTRSRHERDFRASIDTLELGPTRVAMTTHPELEATRDPKLIRQSDNELYLLTFNLRGQSQITHDQNATVSKAGDLVIMDSSRPVRSVLRGDSDRCREIAVTFPRAALPLPEQRVRALLHAPLPGRTGLGRVLSTHLAELFRAPTAPYNPNEAARLGAITVDLTASLIAHHLDAEKSLPTETHERVLLTRIHTFIQRNLSDPNLGPATIAAAHGLSVRHLHRLFEGQGTTVSSSIRSQRVERCRTDLTDRRLSDHPVHLIGARWGFSDAAHFSRVFRTATGTSPRSYRQQFTPEIQ